MGKTTIAITEKKSCQLPSDQKVTAKYSAVRLYASILSPAIAFVSDIELTEL